MEKPNEFFVKYIQLIQHIEAQVDEIMEILKSRQAIQSSKEVKTNQRSYLASSWNLIAGVSDTFRFYTRKKIEQKIATPYSEQLLQEFVAVSERIKIGRLNSQPFNSFLRKRKKDKKEEALIAKIAKAELCLLDRSSLHVSSQITYLHEYQERLKRLQICLDDVEKIALLCLEK